MLLFLKFMPLGRVGTALLGRLGTRNRVRESCGESWDRGRGELGHVKTNFFLSLNQNRWKRNRKSTWGKMMFKGCDNYGANYFGPTGQAQSLVSQVSPQCPMSPPKSCILYLLKTDNSIETAFNGLFSKCWIDNARHGRSAIEILA